MKTATVQVSVQKWPKGVWYVDVRSEVSSGIIRVTKLVTLSDVPRGHTNNRRQSHVTKSIRHFI
jgi:hypothetical protein